MKKLYEQHIKLQWKIIEKLKVLLERYTLRDIQLASQFDADYLKLLYNAIPHLKYKHKLPPSFAACIPRSVSQKEISIYLNYYISQKPNITCFRQYIRQNQTCYKKDKIKVANAKFNKSLYFLKRQLYTSQAEMKDIILKELKDI